MIPVSIIGWYLYILSLFLSHVPRVNVLSDVVIIVERVFQLFTAAAGEVVAAVVLASGEGVAAPVHGAPDPSSVAGEDDDRECAGVVREFG